MVCFYRLHACSASMESRNNFRQASPKRLQVWDARKLKSPLAAFADLPAAPQAQCCFSPDESLIATGTANVPGAHGGGALVSLPFNACLLTHHATLCRPSCWCECVAETQHAVAESVRELMRRLKTAFSNSNPDDFKHCHTYVLCVQVVLRQAAAGDGAAGGHGAIQNTKMVS